jgi:hypothetical protein
MQFTRLAVLTGCSVLAFAQAGFAAPTLVPMDEAVTTLAPLVSANPPIPAFQYGFGANPVATLVTANPLLCGNTAAATGTNPAGILPVYYSANGSVGSSPQPFVFGAASVSPSTSAVAYGTKNLVYNLNQVRFDGDPLDALVCYGLTSSDGVTFVHKTTRDLFADDFEVSGTSGILGNSSVALNVIQLPNAGNGNYYMYTIDVTIPPLPSGTDCNVLDCNFALIEGYDTSVLDPASGQWCLAQTGNPTSCGPGGGGTLPSAGDININYSNYSSFAPNISLAAPIAPAPAKVLHFYSYRKLLSTATLPASGAPVVMAALFSPLDLLENKLDDNVSTGNNTLANLTPSVADSSALSTALTALQENADSGTLSFIITDPDTVESSGNLLGATVSLNLPNGIQVPVAADCGSTSPITTTPVNRTCTIDIPFNNATFWDPFVATQYQGQFNDVATDAGSGVTAGVSVVVTDAAGKSSAPVSLPAHIFSTKNDAPVVTFDANRLPPVQDPNDSNSYPTYTCSVSAGTNTGGCGAPNQFNTSLIAIDFSSVSVFTAVPGPTAAFDELASQTTVANNYTGIDGGNVNCANEQAADVFAPSSPTYGGGGPLISIASGGGTASVGYKVDFAIPSTAPATTVSAVCSLGNTISDAMQGGGGFPNSESAATVQSTFRIVVNP